MEGYTLGTTAKNLESREAKSFKMLKILGQYKDLTCCRVLDIGTGAGAIAHALSEHAEQVDSVDIVDDRIIKDGYTQKLVPDETLPYPDGTFDVVVSNHVLEHVPDQRKHLAEIARVLKHDGIAYLGSPNKWWLTDPHYKLPFISWLPRRIASWYLKVTKKRKWDIYSVSLRTLNKLAAEQHLQVVDESWNVLRDPAAYNMKVPGPVAKTLRLVPAPARRVLLNVMPTHLKILRPEGS